MAHGIFTVTFLLMLYFLLSFNDILLDVFSKNPIKLAKTVNSNQNVSNRIGFGSVCCSLLPSMLRDVYLATDWLKSCS